MKVTTEELERCEILLTIEVEPAQEQKMLEKAAKKIAQQVPVPGFRPGKAPYNTIVRRFGVEAVQQEALENSMENIIHDALHEAELRPSAQVSFDSVSWNPLTLKIKVPGQPKVVLGDYRDLRLEAKPVEVTEDDVNENLKRLQEQHATWGPVERPAELNDLIAMSVVEKHDEEVLAEHDSIEYELRLPELKDEAKNDETGPDNEAEAEKKETSTPFQPDLTTPLLGLRAGDEKTFRITYPEKYEDDKYAGKEITFTIKVSSVKEKGLDPLDDEFAQAVSDFDTLAELKEDIEKKLKERRELEANRELGQSLLDKIVEEAETIEWPLVLEEDMIDNEIERFNTQFEQSGFNLDTYLQIQKQSKEDFREEIRGSIITGLKRSVALAELAKLEEINVTNSEILERTKSIADAFGGGDQIWQYLLASEPQQNRIANEMLTDKMMLRLAAIAKGESLAPEAEVGPQVETDGEVVGEIEADPAAMAATDEEIDKKEEAIAETPEQETVALVE